jgi:hypothetical protein
MPIAIRFHGQRTAAGRIRKFRTTTLERLTNETERQTRQAVDFIKEQLRAAYVSGEGSGRLANSVAPVIVKSADGVEVSISVGDFRELQFLTNLFGGELHSTPYPIVVKNAKSLHFYWKREGREFWGPKVVHPGFPQGDVLANSSAVALNLLKNSVLFQFKQAVAEITVE